MAPYEVRGSEVWSQSGGKWRLKQKCKNIRNAHIVVSNLTKLDKGEIAKWGDRFSARKGKK